MANLCEKELEELIQTGTFLPFQDPSDHLSVLSRFAQYIDAEIPLEDLRNWFEKPAPVYLVATRGKEQLLIDYLKSKSLPFEGNAIIKTQHSPLLSWLLEEGIARVQDKATAESLAGMNLNGKVWDCCCGAGGKSLYVAQAFPETALYCSDKRPNILQNLEQRFDQAGIQKPKTTIADLMQLHQILAFGSEQIQHNFFDVVVADVPCTGSGTWRHNPEAAHFFDPHSIQTMKVVQAGIIKNCLPFLKPGGTLVYITCSVFKEENKLNVTRIAAENDLEMISQTYTGGYAHDSDYIFRALLRKK